MPRRKALNINRIIANNPKVNVGELAKGMKVIHDLIKSGLVDQSSYDLDVPNSNRAYTIGEGMFGVRDKHALRFRDE